MGKKEEEQEIAAQTPIFVFVAKNEDETGQHGTAQDTGLGFCASAALPRFLLRVQVYSIVGSCCAPLQPKCPSPIIINCRISGIDGGGAYKWGITHAAIKGFLQGLLARLFARQLNPVWLVGWSIGLSPYYDIVMGQGRKEKLNEDVDSRRVLGDTNFTLNFSRYPNKVIIIYYYMVHQIFITVKSG